MAEIHVMLTKINLIIFVDRLIVTAILINHPRGEYIMSTTPTTLDEALELVSYRGKINEANNAVRNYSLGSAIVGTIPVPMLDVAALIALNLKMLHKLSTIYDVEFSEELGKSAIISFLGACGSVSISGRLIWGLSTILPIAGSIIRVITLPLFAASVTYAIGQLFIQHFESGGTFLTFDPEKVHSHFHARFEEGKKAAAKK